MYSYRQECEHLDLYQVRALKHYVEVITSWLIPAQMFMCFGTRHKQTLLSKDGLASMKKVNAVKKKTGDPDKDNSVTEDTKTKAKRNLMIYWAKDQ